VNLQQSKDGAAIILAGGRSSRMGRPKAMLHFAGEPLISHIVRKLASLFSQVIVVAAPGQEIPPMGITLVRDEVSYQGPVGGIYYGMRASDHPICFVTSCDAPFLSVPLISHLLSQISGYDVVVPVWEERLEPLHAVYRSSVLPVLQAQLERNELRPIFLYDKVCTCKVFEEEIRRFDPDGLSFLNMNTPEDYDSAVKRWRTTRQREETETAPLHSASVPTSGSLSVSVSVSVSDVPVSVTVELFGVARLLAKTSKVSLELAQEATLSQLILSLGERLPALVGQVIDPETKSLTRGHACNINGQAFVRDLSTKIHRGDNVFILSADAGG